MSDYVLDANVIMSMLISGKANYRELTTVFRFVTIDFVFDEIRKYKDVIAIRSAKSPPELQHFTEFIFAQLTVLPDFILQEDTLLKATKLCTGIDLKDVSYVALSLQLNLPLLTRDKPLTDGLRQKGFRDVMLFNDFLKRMI